MKGFDLAAKQAGGWRLSAIVALIFTALATVVQRQDANWDLRNYHLYNPLAWLDGRYAYDIAPAQLQTWHNPTLDLPLAWLVRAGADGWLTTLWLALPSFVSLFLALRLLDRLWPSSQGTLRAWMAGLVAVTGAAVYPGTASSFNDNFVAAFVLAGLWWLADSHRRRSIWSTWLPIGLLGGVAAGLKLTAAIYCIGFIAAALCAGPIRSMPARIAALGVGGLLGAVLTWGPWGWFVWEQHGNPLFPYFNQWFRSPDALPSPYRDLRFLPETALEAWTAPLRLLHRTTDFSEIRLADPRVLLGLLALATWWWRGGTKPAADIGAKEGGADGDSTAALRWPMAAFAIASFVSWINFYGIYRYLYTLELLFSIAVVGVVSLLFAKRWARTALIVTALLVIAPTKHPKWGRDPFQSPAISVEFPRLPADSLVVLSTQEPIGHAIAFLPREVPAVSIFNNFMDPPTCTRMQSRAESRIATHRGPLWLLRPVPSDAQADSRLALYGLSVAGACRPIKDTLTELELCPLQRAPAATVCAAPPGR